MEVFHMAIGRSVVVSDRNVAALFETVSHDAAHAKDLTMYALKWNSLRDFHSRERVIKALVRHGSADTLKAMLDCVGVVEYPAANIILCNALLVVFSKVCTHTPVLEICVRGTLAHPVGLVGLPCVLCS